MVATTTIVGDVVKQIGGDAIELTVLLPVSADPHHFEPTPQDMVRVAGARVVFANGAGLEAFLDALLASAGGQAETVHVSEGIALRHLEEGHKEEGAEHGHEDEGEQKGHDHEYGGGDPHVWTDPRNVIVWTENIERALSRLDPGNAARYQANAAAYRGQLQALDAWMGEQLAQIPPANRKLVTDHLTFGYLADRHGFKQIGAVLPAFSTLAEPSAKDIALLQDAMRTYGVRAIFVDTTVSPNLAQRIAADTGAQLVLLHSASLTRPGGGAESYLELMRHNVEALVAALR